MALLRTALRLILAVVVWWAVVFPALAIFGAFVLPPDPYTHLFVLAPGFILAVVAAIVFVYRSGSLRQLGRFAIAVLVVQLVVGFPISALFNVFSGVESLLAVITALFLLTVSYTVGYYLSYGHGYERVKARYTDGGIRG